MAERLPPLSDGILYSLQYARPKLLGLWAVSIKFQILDHLVKKAFRNSTAVVISVLALDSSGARMYPNRHVIRSNMENAIDGNCLRDPTGALLMHKFCHDIGAC